MALNGLQIQKLLPKTNCKECGSNTCLAFAMKLAAKKADLSECPYASEEAKQVLGAASEPPVKEIKLGKEKTVAVGAETVLYRHEKTFVNQTVLAININDTDENGEKTLADIRDYVLERVGEVLTVQAVAITQKQSDTGKFVAFAAKAHEMTGLPLILKASDTAAMEQAAAAVKGSASLLAGVTADNANDMRRIAEDNGHFLAVTAPTVDGMTALTTKLKEEGFNNLVMEFQTGSLAEQFQTNAIARTVALKHSVKSMGYVTLRYIDTGDFMEDSVAAITEILKYGGICVLPTFDPAQLTVLMTLRLNIYTDPQKPIQVEPKVYAIGEPDRNSLVFVTTNFSLTYFLVSGEIENSGVDAWLVIPECEGLSVLTAWAAGKFSGPIIAKFIKEIGLEEMVDTRKITIPGYVAQISGELEEALPGWEVLVGCQESVDIESYIKTLVNK